MNRLFAATLTVAGCFLCSAQVVEFEAASIRPSGPQSVRGWEGGPGHRDPTHFRFGQATLKDLIVEAWDVDYFQVSAPAGIDHGAFDLETVMPEGTTKEQFHEMTQRLLAERFGVKRLTWKKRFSGLRAGCRKGVGLKIRMQRALTRFLPAPMPLRMFHGQLWPELNLLPNSDAGEERLYCRAVRGAR